MIKNNFIDLTGQKYGKFTVLSYSHKENNKHYWNIKCECETILSLCTGHLNQKSKTSYGCLNCGQKKRTKASHERIYNLYTDSANRRGLKFNLTIDQFKNLIETPCSYCGIIYSIHYRNNKHSYKYNGIDRVDNSKGYEFNNCVTCCKICNQAKHKLPIKEFLDWLNQIVKYRNNKV